MKEQKPVKKAWEDFYNSGSVGAYLMYRAIADQLEKERKQ